MDHVIRSDARKEGALREFERQSYNFPIYSHNLPLNKVLTNALENASEPMTIVRARRKVHHGRLERKLAEMKEIATRRSGARGAKARKHLNAMEEQVTLSAVL